MGWSGAGGILGAVAEYSREHMNDLRRIDLYHAVVKELEDQDADTLYECEGIDPVLDAVLKKRGHLYGEDE